MYKKYVLSIIGILLVVSILGFAIAGEMSTFSADIYPRDGSVNPSVGIQVPDNVYLGNVTIGGSSVEIRVYVNNTGTANIRVTPQLNASDTIMSNLYLRKFQTGVQSNYSKIGSFSFNVAKPSSGASFNDEYFYVILNLTNYSGNIGSPLINYEADIKFVAVAY